MRSEWEARETVIPWPWFLLTLVSFTHWGQNLSPLSFIVALIWFIELLFVCLMLELPNILSAVTQICCTLLPMCRHRSAPGGTVASAECGTDHWASLYRQARPSAWKRPSCSSYLFTQCHSLALNSSDVTSGAAEPLGYFSTACAAWPAHSLCTLRHTQRQKLWFRLWLRRADRVTVVSSEAGSAAVAAAAATHSLSDSVTHWSVFLRRYSTAVPALPDSKWSLCYLMNPSQLLSAFSIFVFL